MAYILINKDNSVNYIGEHPVNDRLDFTNVKLLEFPDKTAADILGSINPMEAHWDGEKIIRDPILEE